MYRYFEYANTLTHTGKSRSSEDCFPKFRYIMYKAKENQFPRDSKQYFSHVGTEPLRPWYNQYIEGEKESCSRTKHDALSEDHTPTSYSGPPGHCAVTVKTAHNLCVHPEVGWNPHPFEFLENVFW